KRPPAAGGGKMGGKSGAKNPVGRPAGAKIAPPRRDHVGIVAEQREPGVRPQRGGEPDRLGDGKGDGAAEERDAQRPPPLAGADIGADHRHQRRAEPEDERHEEIFQPRGGGGAGGRAGARGVGGERGGGGRGRGG